MAPLVAGPRGGATATAPGSAASFGMVHVVLTGWWVTLELVLRALMLLAAALGMVTPALKEECSCGSSPHFHACTSQTVPCQSRACLRCNGWASLALRAG